MLKKETIKSISASKNATYLALALALVISCLGESAVAASEYPFLPEQLGRNHAGPANAVPTIEEVSPRNSSSTSARSTSQLNGGGSPEPNVNQQGGHIWRGHSIQADTTSIAPSSQSNAGVEQFSGNRLRTNRVDNFGMQTNGAVRNMGANNQNRNPGFNWAIGQSDPTRKPDRYADNPQPDADGVRHFANGRHFDLSKMSLDEAIATTNASTLDPQQPRNQVNRFNQFNQSNQFTARGGNVYIPNPAWVNNGFGRGQGR